MKVELDKPAREILNLYLKNPMVHFSIRDLTIRTGKGGPDFERVVAWLWKRGFLETDPNYAALHPDEIKMLGGTIAVDTPLRITRNGEIALEGDRRFLFGEFRAWSTLAIAVLALILSVISLVGQSH